MESRQVTNSEHSVTIIRITNRIDAEKDASNRYEILLWRIKVRDEY